MGKHLHKLLIRSFDETLNDRDQQKLNEALIKSAALRKEKEKLAQIRTFSGQSEQSFRPFFASRVMNKLENLRHVESEENDQAFQFSFAFNRLAVSGAFLILVLLGITYFTTGSLSLDAIIGISELSTEHLGYVSLYDF